MRFRQTPIDAVNSCMELLISGNVVSCDCVFHHDGDNRRLAFVDHIQIGAACGKIDQGFKRAVFMNAIKGTLDKIRHQEIAVGIATYAIQIAYGLTSTQIFELFGLEVNRHQVAGSLG